MPEIHLRQPGFTYSACGAFPKNKETMQHLKKQEIHDIFYQSKLDKAFYNMTWLMEILRFN